MKSKTYHTINTVSKSNRKIVEAEAKIDISDTQWIFKYLYIFFLYKSFNIVLLSIVIYLS
jgi:hypothetical protein